MKALVYGAEGFLGINIIENFCREDYRVVGIYEDKNPDYVASTAHSKYISKHAENINDIIKTEKPDVIVYAKAKPISTMDESREKIDEVATLAEYSALNHTDKVIYMSNISVYGFSEECYEAAPINPADIDARTHALCEQALFCFRTDTDLTSVALRICSGAGRYCNAEYRSFVYDMIDEAATNGRISTGLGTKHALLSSGDIVDAVLRSVGEGVNGIYNITPKELIEGTEIAAKIYEAMGITHSGGDILTVSDRPLPPNHKATLEIGFVCLTDYAMLLQVCVEWYNESKKTAKVKTPERISRRHLFVQIIESLAFFAICAGITIWQGVPSGVLAINMMVIYIIVTAVLFGLNHAILAAVLVSIFDIGYTMYTGYSIASVLYNINVLTAIVQNFIIAMSIGYVVERKEVRLRDKDALIARQDSELAYLKQINQDIGNIKNEQERRVLKYEYGFGMIYSAIKHLNTLSPQEVFFNSLVAIKNLIDEENISLYIVQPQSGYMRRFIYVGNEPKKFPKSYRFTDNEEVKGIIDNNSFYTNNFLNADMPSAIMPVSVEGNVVALIIIEDMAFEKLTLYYLNILRMTGNLLNDTYGRASIYASLSSRFAYENKTPILTRKEFSKTLTMAMEATSSSEFEFTLLKLSSKMIKDDRALSNTVADCVRAGDEIGRLESGAIGLLLYSTSTADAQFVVDRLARKRIDAEIIEIRESV